ncbi:DUF6058 family natural product biosynthesis protein [Massilia horti]|uniref:Uncharacterized protein n=1 Tax=Massilia horti TaxID=2562153 RepID=A0A4Y9SLE9_9BURK|nr:DUF6058 family natural product biosynthesis protein [Massilia horti]TFW27490.1 hypothetical protein E4O92_24120 [Massilia horti]
MDLIQYLTGHFYTREQLLEHARLDGQLLDQWQQRRMMPKPSYRLRLDIACDSFFGAHREAHAIDYYAKGYVAWAALLPTLTDEVQAHALFADRYRKRLAELGTSGLGDFAAALSDSHIESEWQHFLDGTYGLCTVSGLPEDIATKEAAIVVIRELTVEQVLTSVKRERLSACVDLLDGVSSPFAPHEVARSSRRRYIDDVRRAFRL